MRLFYGAVAIISLISINENRVSASDSQDGTEPLDFWDKPIYDRVEKIGNKSRKRLNEELAAEEFRAQWRNRIDVLDAEVRSTTVHVRTCTLKYHVQ